MNDIYLICAKYWQEKFYKDYNLGREERYLQGRLQKKKWEENAISKEFLKRNIEWYEYKWLQIKDQFGN